MTPSGRDAPPGTARPCHPILSRDAPPVSTDLASTSPAVTLHRAWPDLANIPPAIPLYQARPRALERHGPLPAVLVT